MSWRQLVRTAAHVVLAATPRAIKIPIYRHVFKFDIADDAKLGCSILDVDHLSVGAAACIGHGNWLSRTRRVTLGRGAEVGFLNLLRGGDEIRLAPYSTVLRFNVLNSIPEHDCDTTPDSRLLLDEGAYVVSGHRLDFTNRIHLGRNVIVAGRNSSLWTHNRQASQPIDIGDFCYLGSEVRLAPGAAMGPYSILGMGGVLVASHEGGKVLGGVPAKAIRDISDEDRHVLRRKSKKSIPEDLY